MVCIPAAVLLLNYLVSSEGFLSPPLNLQVELLDFQMRVQWLPRPENPTGTRYSLELADISNYTGKWNTWAACTNFTMTHCCLLLKNIWAHYSVRVMAEWKEERSNWTVLERSIQLYANNQLSAPDLNVSCDQYSILINLSHKVQLPADVPKLMFIVNLFLMDPINKIQKHIAGHKTNSFSHFTHLAPGSYCINASAFYSEMNIGNHNITKCVVLDPPQTGGTSWVWVIFVIFVGVLLGASLLSVICYMRPRLKTSYIPKALIFFEETGRVLTLIPDQPRAFPLTIADKPAPEPEEVDENSSQGYYFRGHFISGSIVDLEDVVLPHVVDEDLAGLYRTAAMMEEPNDDIFFEERLDNSESTRRHFRFSNAESQTTFEQTELGNFLSLQVDSMTEAQVQSCSFCHYLQQDETDSLHSASASYLEDDYMPRPDPRWMLEVNQMSQKY